MTIMKRHRLTIVFLLITVMLLAILPIHNLRTYAAIPKLDEIRVSLFIDIRGTVPTVTLSSVNGMTIGNRYPNGVKVWFTENKVRANIDQYMVQLLMTTDYTTAKNLYAKLSGGSSQPYIITRSNKGTKQYYVYSGQYATKADAAAAKNKMSADTSLSLLVNKAKITLSGPLHWNAGTYATEAAALNQLQILSQAGLMSQIAYHENASGNVVYSVWLGEAVDTAELNNLKGQAAILFPNLVLQPIDPNLPYFLKKADISFGSSSTDITSLYSINPNGQKAWFTPVDTGVKVKERFDRSYRGSMELSLYNNKLALINVLPFEQYLYSVVSTELGSSWPSEALKAQAVASRTYALVQGLKYKIAHVSDTTFEQAYFGIGREFPAAIAAVKSTEGEVLVKDGKLITPFYYSNSGGMTADASEAWGSSLNYIVSKPSPDDQAQKGYLEWDRIILPNGITGYIRSDFVRDTNEKNAAGLTILEATDDAVNVRPAPHVASLGDTNNNPVATVNRGDRFVTFESKVESNTYSWTRGPYTEQQLRNVINAKTKTAIQGKLETLEVAERGPSGRVTAIKANGTNVAVSNPDSFRSVLNGLPSTRFEIEEMGRYTILGAKGVQTTYPENKQPQYALGAGAKKAAIGQQMFFMNAQGKVKLATTEPNFRFIGYGFGHGVGLSQWGARIWASEYNYDYKQILQYYYNGVDLVKG